jgi:hypothetical protein
MIAAMLNQQPTAATTHQTSVARAVPRSATQPASPSRASTQNASDSYCFSSVEYRNRSGAKDTSRTNTNVPDTPSQRRPISHASTTVPSPNPNDSRCMARSPVPRTSITSRFAHSQPSGAPWL